MFKAIASFQGRVIIDGYVVEECYGFTVEKFIDSDIFTVHCILTERMDKIDGNVDHVVSLLYKKDTDFGYKDIPCSLAKVKENCFLKNRDSDGVVDSSAIGVVTCEMLFTVNGMLSEFLDWSKFNATEYRKVEDGRD